MISQLTESSYEEMIFSHSSINAIQGGKPPPGSTCFCFSSYRERISVPRQNDDQPTARRRGHNIVIKSEAQYSQSFGEAQLLKRAYTRGEFIHMAEKSWFGTCQINVGAIGFDVRFTKPTCVVAGVA
jgi:hypothetical protein